MFIMALKKRPDYAGFLEIDLLIWNCLTIHHIQALSADPLIYGNIEIYLL